MVHRIAGNIGIRTKSAFRPLLMPPLCRGAEAIASISYAVVLILCISRPPCARTVEMHDGSLTYRR